MQNPPVINLVAHLTSKQPGILNRGCFFFERIRMITIATMSHNGCQLPYAETRPLTLTPRSLMIGLVGPELILPANDVAMVPDPPLQRPQRPPLPLRPESREQGRLAPDEARDKIEGISRGRCRCPTSTSSLFSKRFSPRNVVRPSSPFFLFLLFLHLGLFPLPTTSPRNRTPPSHHYLQYPGYALLGSWCQGSFC